MSTRGAIAAVLLIATAAVAAPKSATNPYIAAAQRLFDALEYEEALKTLEQAANWPSSTSRDLASIALLEGVIHAEMGHRDAALAAFKRGIAIDAEAPMPTIISPKIAAIYRQARSELGPAHAPLRPAPAGAAHSPSAPLAAAPPTSSRLPPPTLVKTGPGQTADGVRAYAWLPAVVGGVLLAGGAGFYVMAKNDEHQLRTSDASIQSATALQSVLNRGKLFEALGWIGFGTGAAGLLTAGAFAAFGGPKDGPQVFLAPTPNGAAAAVQWRFR